MGEAFEHFEDGREERRSPWLKKCSKFGRGKAKRLVRMNVGSRFAIQEKAKKLDW